MKLGCCLGSWMCAGKTGLELQMEWVGYQFDARIQHCRTQVEQR